MVRSMLSYTNLPISLLGHAILIVTYLLNRVTSKAIPKTPYETWVDRKPSFKHVKIRGCIAYIKCLK